MFRLLTAGAAALTAVAIAAPAQARPTTAPDQRMTIRVVNANGSGCPDRTAEITVSPDNTAFTVTYSDYTAQVGPKSSPLDFRKNCQLALDVQVPSGFTFAIASADYRGYASLARGAWAQESANYYFQGHSRTTRFEHNLTGPFADDWQRSDRVGIASLSYLPCGERRYLNINTDLRVNRGTSDAHTYTSFISMDSTDAAINTVYHVAWRSCR